MHFRLNFDDQISAALIAKIKRRASDGSPNKALQIMIIEWSTLEDVRNRPENDQIMTGNVATTQDLDDQIEAAFAKIDDEW